MKKLLHSLALIFSMIALGGCATPYFDKVDISGNGSYAKPTWEITPEKEYNKPGEVMAKVTFLITSTSLTAKNACYMRWWYSGPLTQGNGIQEYESFGAGEKMPSIATFFKNGKEFYTIYVNGAQTHHYTVPVCIVNCEYYKTQTKGSAEFIINPDTGKIFGATHVQSYNGEPIYHLISSTCEFTPEQIKGDLKYRIIFDGIEPTGYIKIEELQEASGIAPEKTTVFSMPPITGRYRIQVNNQFYIYNIKSINGSNVKIDAVGTNNQAPTLLMSGIGI
jgi:hypothetical protein